MSQNNRVLDDQAREEFAGIIEEMRALVPDMMARKIERANVQQAFVYDAVQRFGRPEQKLLAVGAHEDTACYSLIADGWSIDTCDPVWNTPLQTIFYQHAGKPTYDLVFATSVIEHVQNDMKMARQMAALTKPGGYVILTTDFLPTWTIGAHKPPECVRMYTVADMHRIASAMRGCSLVDAPSWDQGAIDFEYAGCRYAFSTLVAQKSA